MEKRWVTITDLRGNAVEGATLLVRTFPAGAVATIYSTDSVLSPVVNPLVSDANGYVEYYAANGNYSWEITTNEETRTINDVLHDDPTP